MFVPAKKQQSRVERPKPGGGRYRVPGLRPIREEKGLSHRDVLVLSGLSRTTLYYLENGHHLAREDTIFRLADALGVSPLDLVLLPPKQEEEGADET